ncbi:MAG: hypothetical protein A4E57_03413 [Syntrophorhabdaceae bacterium PtaU1.Bin034]|nr:MAG: hypothetical protein A4E57_03413 [Syntrophorhabdaceae bacterium PtaU1.Bin034]
MGQAKQVTERIFRKARYKEQHKGDVDAAMGDEIIETVHGFLLDNPLHEPGSEYPCHFEGKNGTKGKAERRENSTHNLSVEKAAHKTGYLARYGGAHHLRRL